ncbi:MAG: glycosyltransferase family 4 protein [Bythopirellula sp.]|nr:glycosyltransferase family 4 protein [Bythopirellula sp.]
MAVPQKIVHLIGTLGQFDASHNLRELARSQVFAGSEVTLIAFSASGESRKELASHGIKLDIICKRWGYDPFAARQLVQSLQELRPDIVQLWGQRATDAALIVRRALPDAALVATLVKVPQLRNPWWPNKSLAALDAIVVERAALRQEFMDAGQGEEKVHVIPPGIALPTGEVQSRRDLLAHLNLPSEARLITVAGPLERWQLVDEAIWCFELIRILHEHACLVIVGDGPERPRLERFTRQVTDPNVVRFVTCAEMLDDVLAHTEVYWQPGTSQAISSALLMAMSRGLPIVASNTPAHRRVIQSESNGFLVPPAKRAIWARYTDQLLRNPDLRTKLANAARHNVAENFSLLTMAQAYDQLLRDLAANKRSLCSQPS